MSTRQNYIMMVFAALSVSLAQAGNTNTVVGTWTGKPTVGQLGLATTTYEFSTNAVFTRSIAYGAMSAIGAMRTPPVAVPASQMAGRYSVETNTISFVFQGYEWMTNVATFVFQEDVLVLTEQGKTNHFTRKK